MYMLSSWYTDLMDIYRVTDTGGAVTRQTLTLIQSDVPCRVYSSQTNNLAINPTAATANKNDKLSCGVDVDVRAGDTLMITRGGALNRGRAPVRYIASQPQAFFDPVGGALTGLEHLEVGLKEDNVNAGGIPRTQETTPADGKLGAAAVMSVTVGQEIE